MEHEDCIKLAGVVKESTVDGPGFRYTIFTQGCPHNCPGCHNPETHDINGGEWVKIDDIVCDINKNPLLKGVTLSGGDPFIQAKKMAMLVEKLDRNRLDVICYTGFDYEYLIKNANENNGFLELLKNTDVLIDGKFILNLKSDKLPYRGSLNQRSIDVKKSLEQNKIVLYNF